jgi:Electron transfer DM13
MVAPEGSWFSRWKWVLVSVGLLALIGVWWAFRPEKLWINRKVDEAAPFASNTDPQPLYTGRLEGKAHQTTGRATIYKSADGEQSLRLTDFSTSEGPDVHILLEQSDDENFKQDILKSQLGGIELGPLKANQGDQNYALPASIDLQKYNAVVIYSERVHAVFGVARLEQF